MNGGILHLLFCGFKVTVCFITTCLIMSQQMTNFKLIVSCACELPYKHAEYFDILRASLRLNCKIVFQLQLPVSCSQWPG